MKTKALPFECWLNIICSVLTYHGRTFVCSSLAPSTFPALREGRDNRLFLGGLGSQIALHYFYKVIPPETSIWPVTIAVVLLCLSYQLLYVPWQIIHWTSVTSPSIASWSITSSSSSSHHIVIPRSTRTILRSYTPAKQISMHQTPCVIRNNTDSPYTVPVYFLCILHIVLTQYLYISCVSHSPYTVSVYFLCIFPYRVPIYLYFTLSTL